MKSGFFTNYRSDKKPAASIFFYKAGVVVLLFFTLHSQRVFAQPELKPYGNLDGIRIKGQLMEFNTRIVVVGKSWLKLSATGKELQQPKYARDGDDQIVNTQIDSLLFTETVKDDGRGAVKITIKCVSREDTTVKGIYLNISLPANQYAGSMVKTGNGKGLQFDQTHLNAEGNYLQQNLKEISFITSSRSIWIHTDSTSSIIARPDTGANKMFVRLYLPICSGIIHKGDMFEKTYRIHVSGDIDSSPVVLKMDTVIQSRTFAGLGGNFRLQNPKTDPQVIDYCLKNLRVAWGRVEMPWRNWQPDSLSDPLLAGADTMKLNDRVRKAMEMEQRLSKMNIPVILTAWFPPAWAVTGKLHYGKSPEGIWGNPLNSANMSSIYQSITDYILYLKMHYGVDVLYFSFNESDLGINIRQTGAEHDELIRGLGAYFTSKGLKTKLLLGDNSDATTYRFIYPAMNDPKALPYIGAVSFHSWRGWDTEVLQKWAEAADKIDLPLLIGEGSIDAAASAYPAYFKEESYALEEINLYTRLLSICRPLSILQWQLTADYSPLTGGGIYGDNSPLKPTQRFWNLKQLASTPKDLHYISLAADKSNISCAALGNAATHSYTLHIVNNGTARGAHLTGLPSDIKKFKIYVTNKSKDMKQLRSIKVSDHEASFKLESRCFTTLMSQQ